MMENAVSNHIFCPREEIAAYLDGELAPRTEIDLELHFAACQVCNAELNAQKKLLSALDFSFEQIDEIEIPENFTRIVVANAESNVKGLRCPRERHRALFVCAALFVLMIFGLGAETSRTFADFGTITEQFLAVGGFFAHLINNLTIAATVILRSVCLQFVFKSAINAGMIFVCFAVSLAIFSGLISKQRRF